MIGLGSDKSREFCRSLIEIQFFINQVGPAVGSVNWLVVVCDHALRLVSFQIFPWCLKAKFQIPPLRSVMFAVNTTTRAASNLDYLQFCSSQPLLSPGTVHQKFECFFFKILSEFSNFEWVLSQTPRFFQTPRILSGIWLKFWNFEALIWAVSGVMLKSKLFWKKYSTTSR